MYILLALIAVTSVGVGVHFALPHRELRGAAFTPAVTAIVAAVIYAALTWAGVGEANVWQWVATILGSIASGLVAAIVITRSRLNSDRRERERLGIS